MAQRISTEIDGLTLLLSNLDKPLFQSGFTKGELIHYYVEIAELLIPHIRDRAVTRVRFPDGTAHASFYEKNAPAGTPEFVQTVDVATSAGTVSYVTITQRADLAWLANLASIELHTPQWRIGEATAEDSALVLDGLNEPRATSLVIDLDPGPGVTTAESAQGAILTATTLAELGLVAHPKSSGNKGLQLSVPIAPTPSSRVYEFARSLARHLARTHPKRFTAEMAKQARTGLTFVDYAQNLAARNTVHAYSVRGLDSPSVSTPFTWEEVASLNSPAQLRTHPTAMLERLQEMGDLWMPTMPSDASPLLPDPID